MNEAIKRFSNLLMLNTTLLDKEGLMKILISKQSLLKFRAADK